MSDNLYSHSMKESKPASSSRNVWYLALSGCGCLLMLLLCGGGIAAIYFGLNLVEEDLKVQLRDHPQVREHLGELQTIDVNFIKSGAIEDDEALVYDMTGSKGSAEVTIVSETPFSGPEEIRSATMRLSDGRVVELDLDMRSNAEVEPLPADD